VTCTFFFEICADYPLPRNGRGTRLGLSSSDEQSCLFAYGAGMTLDTQPLSLCSIHSHPLHEPTLPAVPIYFQRRVSDTSLDQELATRTLSPIRPILSPQPCLAVMMPAQPSSHQKVKTTPPNRPLVKVDFPHSTHRLLYGVICPAWTIQLGPANLSHQGY